MSWWALAVAAALQLVASVIRARAWWHVIRETSPEAAGVRYRDVAVAQLGGVGWNAVLPAHSGDAVKVAIVSRKVPNRHLSTLVATLVPPAAVEAVFTAILVAGILAAGFVSLDDLTSALPSIGTLLVIAGVVALAAVAIVVFRRRLAKLLDDVRAGLALGRPSVIATRVVPWLAVARVVRLLAFALVLTAAGVPFGILPALALMALQGATPSAGAAATAARIALISAVLTATGAADVPATEVAKTLAAAYGVTSAVNLAVSGVVVAWLLRTASPRRILAYGRSAVQRVRRSRARPGAKPRPADGTRP